MSSLKIKPAEDAMKLTFGAFMGSLAGVLVTRSISMDWIPGLINLFVGLIIIFLMTYVWLNNRK